LLYFINLIIGVKHPKHKVQGAIFNATFSSPHPPFTER